MTLKDFLSSLGTLNVQVIIRESDGTDICKVYADSSASLDNTLKEKNIEHWSIVRTTLLVVNLEGEEEPVTPDEPISVDSVSLNTDSLELIIGDEVELVATVLPENATNKEIEWSVSDNEIVSCDNGAIIALSEGSATVTVTTLDGGFTAICEVNVVQNEG